MSLSQEAGQAGASHGPPSAFGAEAERHRRFLAGRAQLRPAAAADPAGEGPPALALVVEDDEATRAAMEALLGASGWRVAATCLGEEAVRMAAELRPDVVLLDLVLPRSSGLDTARVLREQDATGGLSLVAMTGLWLADQPELLASAGFDGALRKPFTGADLLAELERVLAPAAVQGTGAA